MNAAVKVVIAVLVLACACNDPERLVAGTCGNGAVDPGEDCDGDSGGSELSCGAPGTAHACHFLCDPSSTAAQCPRGDICGSDGTCVAAPGVCGNGIIQNDEECDPTIATTKGTCGAAGTPNGCHYVCGATTTCPAGASCGRDGRCREPSGQFGSAAPFQYPAQSFALLDVDGDGFPDLVDLDGLLIQFGAGDGTFPQSVALPGSLVTGIGDLTGDGRVDFALRTVNATTGPIQVAFLGSDRTLTLAPFPTFDVSNPGTTSDMWLPIAPASGNPLQELLHVAISGGSARFDFDQFGPSPFAVTVPAPSTFPVFPGKPPPFAIADAIDDPAVGGDEIAIGMPGTSTIEVLTASAQVFDGEPGLTIQLVHDATISLGSGKLWAPPIFADADGDGRLDIIAAVNPGNNSFLTVDVLNTGTGFGSAVPDPQLACIPQAAARLFPGQPSAVFCGSFVLQRGSDGLQGVNDNQIGLEAVFPDLNRDGIPDIVLAGAGQEANSLVVMYGSPSGLFSIAPVPITGQAVNLRVGDFNGDRIDDVMFFVELADGEQQYEVLYGSTGDLAAPVTVATLSNVTAAEPAVLSPDVTLNGATFPLATSDVVVSSSNPAAVVQLFGNSNHTLTSSGFELDTTVGGVTGPPVIGKFVAGQTAASIAVPIEANPETGPLVDVIQLATDANGRPQNQLPRVVSSAAAPAFGSGFEVVACVTQSVVADFDGDGVDEIAIVPTGSESTQCAVGDGPSLFAVFQVANPNAVPATLSNDLDHITGLRALDVDGDGHLDLVAVFRGDPSKCTTSPCVPPGGGIAVVWGTPTGLGSATSELVPSLAEGELFDAALLPLAPGDHGHLLVASAGGVITVSVGSDRSLQAGPTLTPIFATSLATGDVNGDGLIDLVLDSRVNTGLGQVGQQITVLLSESQPIH